jgi:Tfp pilus assembly protein PilN
MDHLGVLRGKIARLRAEIAEIQTLNERYRSEVRNNPQAQAAHGERQERLQAIQQELAKLAGLGRRVLSLEQRKDARLPRLHLVKKAS